MTTVSIVISSAKKEKVFRIFSSIFLSLAILCATTSAWAIQPGDDLPTFDSRLEVPAFTQAAVESVSAEEIAAQNNAEDLLRAGDVNFRVSYDELFGTPTFVRSTSRFLTDADPQGDRMTAIRNFVRDNSGLFILNDSVLEGTRISSDYTSANNGVRHIYLQQTINGLDVIGAGLGANFTRDGQLINISSTLLPVPDSLGSSPGITSAQAITNAAANVGITTASPVAESGLAYFPMTRNDIRLVWQVEVPESGNVYQSAVDATSAAVLYRANLTNYFSADPLEGDSATSLSTEDASYLVYETDSPAPDQGTMTRSLQTLKYLDVTASPDGWIDDGNNTTSGNNVEAYTDINADNLPDVGQPTTGAPYRVFSFGLDFTMAPSVSDDASTTQLFYMNNLIHDLLYQVGFDEASGNFQTDNFGKGGLGSDAVDAEGQDGSGTNNANFLTLPDGTKPRMQMYLGTGWVPSHDGVFDTHVVMHEYGHGWSKRLVGGPGNTSVLNNVQQGGEGWSDYLGMLLLAKPGDEVPAAFAAPYPVGTYLINDPGGIRPFPYSTNAGVNPHTYSDISAQVAPHGVGAVWCQILWVTTSKMAMVHGFAAFDEMLQLTSDGLKLTPTSPTFLDARDAILQADLVNNGGANACTLWTGFAERGLGFSATTPGSASKSGTDAFDVSPFACASSAGVVAMDQANYSCGGTINVQLVDLDLVGFGVYPVVLSSTTGDVETLALVENPPASGIFEGSLVVIEGAVTVEDGTLDATNGDLLTTIYNDADDGSGNPAVAVVDAGFVCLPAGAHTLTTTFATNNSFAGNTFDVEVNQSLEITTFDVHLDNPGSVNQIDIYYRLDSSVGNENNAAGWILLGSDPGVVSQGIGVPTPVNIGGLNLSPGTTYGFYVDLASYDATTHILYTNGASTVFTDGIMSITSRTGKGNPVFAGTTIADRIWNGNIHYDNTVSSGKRVLHFFGQCDIGIDNATPALANLGITNVTQVTDDPAFAAELAGNGPWDLVIVDTYGVSASSASLDALVTYYDGGGSIILAQWNLFGLTPGHAIMDRAGIALTGDYSEPLPVSPWNASSLFTTPNAVPALTILDDGSCGIDGISFVLTTASAHAGYTPGPAAGQAAITIDQDSRFIFNGFIPQIAHEDEDLDTTLDMVELYENEISFLCDDCALPGEPTNPNPADGAVDVPIDTQLSWQSGSPQSGVLYAIRDSFDGAYIIDIASGVPTLIGPSAVTSSTVGLAHSGSTLLYGSTYLDLAHIETDGSPATTFPSPGMEGLAFDEATGTLYAAINFTFFTINPATGALVANLPAWPADVEGLAFDPTTGAQGTVFGTADNGFLYKYDVNSNVISVVGDMGLGAASDNSGLAYAPDLDVLLHITKTTGDLYIVDKTTATATFVANTGIIGADGFAGLAYGPAPASPAQFDGSWTPGPAYSSDPTSDGNAPPTAPESLEAYTIDKDASGMATGPVSMDGYQVRVGLPAGLHSAAPTVCDFDALADGAPVGATYPGVTFDIPGVTDTATVGLAVNWSGGVTTSQPNVATTGPFGTFRTLGGVFDQPAGAVSMYFGNDDFAFVGDVTLTLYSDVNALVPIASTVVAANGNDFVDQQISALAPTGALSWTLVYDDPNLGVCIDEFAFSPLDLDCTEVYDVYFGTNPGNLALLCADSPDKTCDPGLLDSQTPYFWQVVAKNCCGETVGPVWSFTTGVPTFTGIPTEYHFELLGCDIEVIDMVPARDGISIIPCGTLAANFAGVTYNLVPGTNLDDILFGTPGTDLILGFDGLDQLWATGGNDALLGGRQDDSLIGDVGNNLMHGGDGGDIIITGSGNDDARGGAGVDFIVLTDPANPGNTFDGGPDGDALFLSDGYGSFTLNAEFNFEFFVGGDGDDNVDWSAATTQVFLLGNAGNDTLTGGSGPDYIDGGANDDTLTGNDGADGLLGQGGVNHLYPGNGNDSVISHDGTGIGNVHYAPGPLTLPCWDMQLFGTFWTVQDNCNGSGFDIVTPADANFVTP